MLHELLVVRRICGFRRIPQRTCKRSEALTALVPIEAGQWVLAFFQPYYWPDDDMREHLERFTTWGGGWDGHRATEIFLVHQVEKVMPKTYIAVGTCRRVDAGERLRRTHVVAAGKTEAEMTALRDRFFAIGVKTTKAIEAEMYRRIAPFEKRKHAEALAQVHACFPHIFRESEGQ
jgi:hypothetical protein